MVRLGFRRRSLTRRAIALIATVIAAGTMTVLAAPSQSAPALGAIAKVTSARAAAVPDAGIAFPLHTKAWEIVDAKGHSVKLRFVNWYGGESPDFVVGGLKYQSISKIISQIVADGFNGVRLPFSNQLWQTNPIVSDDVLTANKQFFGEHARTILTQVIQDLAKAGLMIILDDHNSTAEWCCSNTDNNELWYVPGSTVYTPASWESDWSQVAATYKSIPQVIGVDLRNEPRGPASWTGGTADNWRVAAEAGGNAVLSADPNLLIFVEGTDYATDLSQALSLPVTLNVPDRVVYSVHDYGFNTTVTSYDQWEQKIQSNWGYLVGKVPLWVGEFGTCDTSASCVDSPTSAHLGMWFNVFTRYLKYFNLSWSYWALNGTKSDGAPGQNIKYGETETYGVLNKEWDAPASTALLSALQAIQPSCSAGSVATGTYYVENRNSGDVIDIPAYHTAQGTDLDQWPRNNGSNQRWKVTRLSCNLYEITSVLDGESIDILGQSTGNGARVDEYDYWSGGNQQFILTKNSAGYYTIESLNSLKAITVVGASTKAGAGLEQEPATSGTSDQWSFVSG